MALEHDITSNSFITIVLQGDPQIPNVFIIARALMETKSWPHFSLLRCHPKSRLAAPTVSFYR